MIKAVDWQGEYLRLIDQTQLPQSIKYRDCWDHKSVAEAIRQMQVRGAPAIGAAAAFGIVLAAKRFLEARNVNEYKCPANENDLQLQAKLQEEYLEFLKATADELRATRPTAVNLFWAIERMLSCLNQVRHQKPLEIMHRLEKEARTIYTEDLNMNHRIGQLGISLVSHGSRILTHCNAGALATSGYGTALGVIRAAWESGLNISVWVDETRPLLQGARLTSWELLEEGIPVTLITDNMAGYLMQQGKVDLVIVGADRITVNGDVANKIGTYSLAVLARDHGIPFYVAAPWSTVDTTLSSGQEIPIEERDPDEIRKIFNQVVAPATVPVYNPAFDVTPSNLISAIITDRGIAYPPYQSSLAKFAAALD